jgi:hypothetical protein
MIINIIGEKICLWEADAAVSREERLIEDLSSVRKIKYFCL